MSVLASALSQNMNDSTTFRHDGLPIALQELVQLQKLMCDDHSSADESRTLDLDELEELECSLLWSSKYPLCMPDFKPNDFPLAPASGKLHEKRDRGSGSLFFEKTLMGLANFADISADSAPQAVPNWQEDNCQQQYDTSSSTKMVQETTMSCPFENGPTSISSVVTDLHPLIMPEEKFHHQHVTSPLIASPEAIGDVISATCSTTSSANGTLEDDGTFYGLFPPEVRAMSAVTRSSSLANRVETGASPVSVTNTVFAHGHYKEVTSGKEAPGGGASFPSSTMYKNVGGATHQPCTGMSNFRTHWSPDHQQWSRQMAVQQFRRCIPGYPSSTTSTSFQLQEAEYRYVESDLLPSPDIEKSVSSPHPLPKGKEMLYRAAALRPIYHLSSEALHRPKRRNVKISKDPQSVAARRRRERISEKIQMLQRLVPGGTKMDTASMLDEAVQYMKFLQMEVTAMNSMRSRQLYTGSMLSDANQSASSRMCCPINPTRPLTKSQLQSPYEKM